MQGKRWVQGRGEKIYRHTVLKKDNNDNVTQITKDVDGNQLAEDLGFFLLKLNSTDSGI